MLSAFCQKTSLIDSQLHNLQAECWQRRSIDGWKLPKRSRATNFSMVFSNLFGNASSMRIDRSPANGRPEGPTMTSEELQRAAASHEENQRLLQQVAALQDTSSASSDTPDEPGAKAELSAVEKEIWELKKSLGMLEVSAMADEKNVAGGKLEELKKKVNAVAKGLDLCFLVDCTSSMGWCIEEVKIKVQSIADTISKMHEESVINMAFVGYRDYLMNGEEEPDQYQVQDFLPNSKMATFQKFVNNLKAEGGGDPCEDVVGGLKHALGLSWKSSTRLIIHFCDYPAHGTAYHNFSVIDGKNDNWPKGDPKGNKLEDLMQQLCNRRIDYYFAAIATNSAKMAGIMQECYAHSHNAKFQIVDWKDADTSFAPLIINSVRSSMQRSAHFDKLWDSAESNLTHGNRKGRSVFHATVG